MSFAEDSPNPILNVPTLMHDLRQPLGNIEACTSLLRIFLERSPDARIRECLDLIEGQVEAMDRILHAASGKPLSPPVAF